MNLNGGKSKCFQSIFLFQLLITGNTKIFSVFFLFIRRIISKNQFIIQALWAGYKDFNEILISPSMIRDHMPDKIMEALHSLLINTGPPKPQRANDGKCEKSHSTTPSSNFELSQTNIILETSFANSNDNEIYNEECLKRLRSLIAKRRAPLATPESVSLTEQETWRNIDNLTGNNINEEEEENLENDTYPNDDGHSLNSV